VLESPLEKSLSARLCSHARGEWDPVERTDKGGWRGTGGIGTHIGGRCRTGWSSRKKEGDENRSNQGHHLRT
jgi:hypothetical protein